MYLSEIDFLRHIFAECEYLMSERNHTDFDSFVNDQRLCRAVCRSLEIFGEASNKLNPDFRGKYPFVPWRELSDIRNKIIHHYFGVDYDIVWDTVDNHIPILRDNIAIIIDREDSY